MWIIVAVVAAVVFVKWAFRARERRIMEEMEAAGGGELRYFMKAKVGRILRDNDGVRLVVIAVMCPGVPIPESPNELAVLNLGRAMRTPTPFRLTDGGLHTTLLFSGVSTDVFIPWSAVYRAFPLNPTGGGRPPRIALAV